MKKFNLFDDIEGVEFPAGRRGRVMYGENGKIVAKLWNPYQTRVETATSLFGVLPNDMTLDEARAERLGAI